MPSTQNLVMLERAVKNTNRSNIFLLFEIKKVLSDIQKKEDMHINPIKTTFSILRYNNLLNPNHPQKLSD